MPGTQNIHQAQLWRLHALVTRDGVIDEQEREALDHQEEICQRMEAAHGLQFRSGGIPRHIWRQHPAWLHADYPPAA